VALGVLVAVCDLLARSLAACPATDDAPVARPVTTQPLTQTARSIRIPNPDSSRTPAFGPLVLGSIGHENEERLFLLDVPCLATPVFVSIVDAPRIACGMRCSLRRSRGRGPWWPCCPGDGPIGGGPEDALLKQPLRTPASAGSTVRRLRKTFIQVAFARLGVRLRRLVVWFAPLAICFGPDRGNSNDEPIALWVWLVPAMEVKACWMGAGSRPYERRPSLVRRSQGQCHLVQFWFRCISSQALLGRVNALPGRCGPAERRFS
jgi:hypothetical protein